jgi:hypothetical protein
VAGDDTSESGKGHLVGVGDNMIVEDECREVGDMSSACISLSCEMKSERFKISNSNAIARVEFTKLPFHIYIFCSNCNPVDSQNHSEC